MDERSKRTLNIIIGLVIAVLLGTIYSSYLMPQKTHLVFGATYMTMNNPFYEVINNELKKEIQFLIKIILNKEDGGKNEKQKNS